MLDLFGENEKPFIGEPFTGPQPGLVKTAGKAVMRGGVRLAEAAALTVAPAFSSESDEVFERKQEQAPDEREYTGLTREDFYRFVEERLEPAADYWSPDPATMTTAGQVVSALFELPLQLAAGPVGLVATPTMSVAKELVDQGVDPKTATGVAVATGATMGAAIALPVAGQTLKQTLSLIALNPAIGAGQDALTAEILEGRGYEEQAGMFDPFNPATRSVDLVLGAIFGGLAQYGRVRQKLPTEVKDALDTVNLAKQSETLSPFVAAYGKEHREAIRQAMRAMTEGRPVDVSRVIEPTAPKSEPAYSAERFREEVKEAFGLADEEADAALALVGARAEVKGESLDSFISRNIAGVLSAESSAKADAAALYQGRPMVEPFYSKVLAEVEGLQQEKWNGPQLLGKLRKTPGVKGEEIAWTGLDEFLAGKKSVTREEVRVFLAENQVRVREVVDEDVKYASYTLPGASDTRSLRLTLPAQRSEGFAFEKIPNGGEWVAYRDGVEVGRDRNLRGLREQVGLAPGEAQPDPQIYRSGHYGEPNILAHVRFNERTGPDGERVLHLEEVQSDWHQQGRSKGYASAGGPIPDAPFAKTWHELALRRMLRYAAEHGFDRLTWTTGEQQAARYDLSKIMNVIRYDYQGDAYKVTGQTREGQYQDFGTFREEQLEDAVGKDLAARMIESRKGGKAYAVYSGLDLKVGGEGMRGFYDKILPSYAGKFGKKFGARVEAVKIKAGNAPDEVLAQHAGNRAFQEANRPTVHSLPVTDAMRDSLLYEGQPLFQGEKGAVSFLADGRALIHALEAPDLSTLVHELAHVFENDLSALERRQFDQWMHSQVPGVKWSTEQRELFARTFERYLAEGKAPAPELQGVFDKFKDWLLAVYQRITGTAIDVKLAPQVRAAFDRMLFAKNLKTDLAPDVARVRAETARQSAEAAEELRADLGLDPEEAGGPALAAALNIPEGPDAAAGFLRSPENVSRVLAEMFEAEAVALEQSRAEQMAADGQALEAMVSDAAEWFLRRNRDLRASGNAMDKKSVVNALRKAARGDFARLTAGQQEMVLAAIEDIARQVQPLVREIDAQELRVGDRFATPDLGQRVVVGERDGTLYLDNGRTLDTAGVVETLGEIDRSARAENMPDSPAEFYLREQGDFEVYAGADSEGNPLMRSAAELIGEARAELAKAESQEHLYKRAAFCLNMG